MNPHLNENYYDVVLQKRHCPNCINPLHHRDTILQDHAHLVWRHYGWVNMPGIRATDERGMTLDTWAQPPRRAHVFLPVQTNISYCIDCLPDFDSDFTGGCAKCRQPINLEEDEYSECEMLVKYSNQRHGKYRKFLVHLDCLPPHFTALQEYRKSLS